METLGQEFINAYQQHPNDFEQPQLTPDHKYELIQEKVAQGDDMAEAVIGFKTTHTAHGDKKVLEAEKTVWVDWQLNATSLSNAGGFYMTAPNGVQEATVVNVDVPAALQGENGYGNYQTMANVPGEVSGIGLGSTLRPDQDTWFTQAAMARAGS